MNLEKFTDRAKGFLQSAQTVAIRMSHQRIGPEHLLKALLEDEQGMASGLIKAAGGDITVYEEHGYFFAKDLKIHNDHMHADHMDRSIGVFDLRPLLQRGEASVPATATLAATASEVLPAAALRRSH